MTRSAQFLLFLLRVAMGWFMFYAGITKVMDPTWTAAGYLHGAKTFTAFYEWLALPAHIGVVNVMNEWGLTLLGVSLIFGIAVRWSSFFGAALMLLYYFPILVFPHPNPHAFIVDEHIIYALLLLFFSAERVGYCIGLERLAERIPGLRIIAG